jgi:2-polyprenyl-3-methyl-5-hydroxy-6-metoxy-1,4-benzoquinol methylase
VLIAGGGTGWILEEIKRIHTDGLEIDYVEASAKMIQLSKLRNYQGNVVNFIQMPIEHYEGERPYDVIITPFLFDNFKADTIRLVFGKLSAMLKTGGVWLYADFVYDQATSPWWQQLLLRSMYLFFKITAGVDANELVDMDDYFVNDYQRVFKSYRYARFIRSIAYKKL